MIIVHLYTVAEHHRHAAEHDVVACGRIRVEGVSITTWQTIPTRSKYMRKCKSCVSHE